MDVHFSKYHGAGNDFIFIDNRESKYKLNDNQRKKLCTRHFGIGADGLLEIKSSDKADFKLLYFNSDGKEGTLCGNGSRCAIAFAFKIGVKHTKVISTDVGVTERDHILQTATESDQQINNMNNKSCIEESKHRTSHILDRGDSELDRGRSEHDSCKDLTFEAFDGIHVGGLSCGTIDSSCYNSSMFYTDIKDVDCENVKVYSNGDIFVNTGSPHHVICLSASVGDLDVVKQGRKVMQELYKKDGCNINFVARCRNTLNSSNFEREIEKCRDCEIMFGNVDSDNAKIFSEKCLQKGPSQLRPEDKGDADIVTHDTSNICLHVRTYERGVENETMACGTGCVAVAIADYVKQSQEKYSKNDDEKLEFFNVEDNTSSDVFNISKYGNKNDNTKLAKNNIPGGIYKLESEKRTIFMPGGCLLVTFTVTNQEKPLCGSIIRFCDMKLSGPVQHVFDGVCVL